MTSNAKRVLPIRTDFYLNPMTFADSLNEYRPSSAFASANHFDHRCNAVFRNVCAGISGGRETQKIVCKYLNNRFICTPPRYWGRRLTLPLTAAAAFAARNRTANLDRLPIGNQ